VIRCCMQAPMAMNDELRDSLWIDCNNNDSIQDRLRVTMLDNQDVSPSFVEVNAQQRLNRHRSQLVSTIESAPEI
jgi:hypothetical protein